MSELRQRFGQLVGAHRRRRELSRADLAARAELSLDMITRIERGATGASFETIERIARALEVDPAELFGIPAGSAALVTPMQDLIAKLIGLDERQLTWVLDLVTVALRRA